MSRTFSNVPLPSQETYQQDVISTQGGASSYAGYASAIQATSSVISGFQATDAFKTELDAKTDAAIRNVGNAVTSFELQQVKNAEQIDNINHVLGDKLSERGLDAIKEESLLKTAAAETGTSGGTTNMAIKEAFINENMDKANIISSARQQTKSILTSMDMATLGIQHTIDSTLLGGGVNIGTSSIGAGINSGLTTATQTLDMIPMSERSSAFGITTS